MFFITNTMFTFIYKCINKDRVIKKNYLNIKRQCLISNKQLKTIIFQDIFYSKINEENFWKKPVKILSKFWILYSSFWHGHEIIGFDNIPEDGPALIIMFHAPIPIDVLYLGAHILLKKKRMMKCVAERAVFNKFGLFFSNCFFLREKVLVSF